MKKAFGCFSKKPCSLYVARLVRVALFLALLSALFVSCNNGGSKKPQPPEDDLSDVTVTQIELADDKYYYASEPYTTNPDKTLSCIVKYPKYEGCKAPASYDADFKLPVFLYIHPGSWTSGNADGDVDVVESMFDEFGFVHRDYMIVWADYTLYKSGSGISVSFADLLEDITNCMRFLKKNADQLHVDTSKLVIGGDSAGGHLSLLYAYLDYASKENIFSPIPICGVYSGCGPAYFNDDTYMTSYAMAHILGEDIVKMFAEELEGAFNLCTGGTDSFTSPSVLTAEQMRAKRDAAKASLEKYSPVTYATSDLNTYLLYGDGDQLVPLTSHNKLADKLGGQKVKDEVFNGGHCEYENVQNFSGKIDNFVKSCLGI